MDRRVTPPKRVTSPSWGPPPPCKQALIGRALALSEISKKMRCKSNHSSLSRVIVEAAFLRHKFTPRSKVSCELQSYGASSHGNVFHGRIFPHHTEKHRDRPKWSLTTFDPTRFVVLMENFDS